MLVIVIVTKTLRNFANTWNSSDKVNQCDFYPNLAVDVSLIFFHPQINLAHSGEVWS